MRILLITLGLFCSLPAFAQLLANYPVKELEPAELIVTYSLFYQQDSLDPNIIKHEEMLLLIGKKISLFLSYNSYFTEEEMKKITSQFQLQQWIDNNSANSIYSAFRYRIFKNFPAGKITHTQKIMPNLLKYEVPLDLFSWELTSDTATIKGYQVQKAISDFGGRSWVAWFCPDIPYSDGPYKFNGLPGLILKVYDTQGHYLFELVSIEKPNEVTMIGFAERQYIETNVHDFFRAECLLREDIISRAKEVGLSSESAQTAARNMKNKNNPIELRCD